MMVVPDRAGWHHHCATCLLLGHTETQDEGIQAILDHFHLYHPRDVLAFNCSPQNNINNYPSGGIENEMDINRR